MFLAVFSIVGGYVGVPHILGGANYFEEFLKPVMHQANNLQADSHLLTPAGHSAAIEIILMISSVILVLISIYLAWYLYRKNTELPGKIRNNLSGVHYVLHGKYFVDELYSVIIVKPLIGGSLFLWKIVDVFIIDGLINGLAIVIGDISSGLRTIQTGRLRTYTAVFLTGVIVLILFALMR